MAELKKYTTFSQQVTILQNKGLQIRDPDDCRNFLSKVNYYRFSGYFLPYIDKTTHKFFENITFEQIKAIYSFDTELRNLISFVIEKIEIYLRTQFSNYHANLYKSNGYLDAKNYNSKHNHNEFIKHIHKIIVENGNTLVVRHHMKNYEGQLPLWVIIDYFSVGELSHFYRSMKNMDKLNLANQLYGVKYETLEGWLRCLTDLRNRCAHYARIYYWVFPAIPSIPSSEKYVPTRRLFAQLYMLKLMYPKSEDWNKDFVKPLAKLIQKYRPYISLKHLDFPYRWKSMLIKK